MDLPVDREQALLDLLAGWASFVDPENSDVDLDQYPWEYVELVAELYQEAGATVGDAEGVTEPVSAADFIRERILPLFE